MNYEVHTHETHGVLSFISSFVNLTFQMHGTLMEGSVIFMLGVFLLEVWLVDSRAQYGSCSCVCHEHLVFRPRDSRRSPSGAKIKELILYVNMTTGVWFVHPQVFLGSRWCISSLCLFEEDHHRWLFQRLSLYDLEYESWWGLPLWYVEEYWWRSREETPWELLRGDTHKGIESTKSSWV